MVSRHTPKLGVDASFYLVVQVRNRSIACELRVEEGEQQVLAYEPVQAVSRCYQSLMGSVHAPGLLIKGSLG